MDDFSISRYLRLIGLTLLLAILIYVVQIIIFSALGIAMPQFLLVTIAVLGAGTLVYKFLAGRIF